MKISYLKKTIELARQGAGHVSPNPMVGAIIVNKQGKIIGEGYHQKYGGTHAEINALDNCSSSPAGATLFVGLEPCCHTNKQTPPCTLRIIEEKIKKVVIASLDPNPLVAGKGVECLQQAGIEVEFDLLEEEESQLNERYRKFITTKLPFIHLKIALTLDGKIATHTGDSRWITNENARRQVHRLRGEYDAVCVGVNTVVEDNPQLNVRFDLNYPNPYRIIIGNPHRIPNNAHVISDNLKEKTILVSTTTSEPITPYPNIKSLAMPSGNLKDLLKKLVKMNIFSILVEGGGHTLSRFLQEKLVDKITFFYAPKILGSGLAPFDHIKKIDSINESLTFSQAKFSTLDDQMVFEGKPQFK